MNRSVDTIMTWLTNTVQEKIPISPQQFVEAAEYLVILIGDEHAKLYDLEQKVAQMKLDLLSTHDKVNKVNIIVEASDVYKEMKIQRARIEQIEETIRIAKLQARMKMDESKLN